MTHPNFSDGLFRYLENKAKKALLNRPPLPLYKRIAHKIFRIFEFRIVHKDRIDQEDW